MLNRPVGYKTMPVYYDESHSFNYGKNSVIKAAGRTLIIFY